MEREPTFTWEGKKYIFEILSPTLMQYALSELG